MLTENTWLFVCFLLQKQSIFQKKNFHTLKHNSRHLFEAISKVSNKKNQSKHHYVAIPCHVLANQNLRVLFTSIFASSFKLAIKIASLITKNTFWIIYGRNYLLNFIQILKMLTSWSLTWLHHFEVNKANIFILGIVVM